MVSDVPGSGEGLAIGYGQAKHGIRPCPQLVIASIHIQLISMQCDEVGVARWGGVLARDHICPLLPGQVQHKQVLQHKVVAAPMDKQLGPCSSSSA